MEKNIFSLGLLNSLAIVFIILKLVDVINWSWWYVLSPIMLNIILSIILVIAVVIIKYYRSR